MFCLVIERGYDADRKRYYTRVLSMKGSRYRVDDCNSFACGTVVIYDYEANTIYAGAGKVSEWRKKHGVTVS